MSTDGVRNVYKDIADRLVIRTPDVYQMQNEEGVAGYSDTLLSIVADFTNSGIPEGCNARSMVGKSKGGEVACQIFAVINPATRVIGHARFRSRGCVAITASASLACTMIEGATIEQALTISQKKLVDGLDGVPADKIDSPLFAAEAVRAMVGDWVLRNEGLEVLDELVPCDSASVNCLQCEHCSLRDLRIDWLVDHRDELE